MNNNILILNKLIHTLLNELKISTYFAYQGSSVVSEAPDGFTFKSVSSYSKLVLAVLLSYSSLITCNST